jgi:DnaJ-class molecular chaperone
MSIECRWCHGTGKDSNAVKAASHPDHCFGCGGSGRVPEFDDEGITDDDVCNQCGYLIEVCKCD